MTIPGTRVNEENRYLSHWIWAAAGVLIVALFSAYQADLAPPSFDEWATVLSTALVDWESPAEFLQWHKQLHPSHMPGYYLLLTLWSALTSPDIAILRVFGILISLLHVALVYRLARDLISPVAALFALVIVASNAFFNFYIADARPYTLFVSLSCATVWIYLRIAHRRQEPTAFDLLGLCAAAFALTMTHLFSVTLLFTLGLYHLIVARKNLRWLRIGLAISAGVLLSLPLAINVLTQYSAAYAHLSPMPLSGVETISAWLRLSLNGQALMLLLIAAVGLYIGKRRGLIRLQPWLALPALFVATLWIAAEITSLIRAETLRHQLDGWILLVLFTTVGHYALYRWKPVLGLLILIWILAGVSFQQSQNWWREASIRAAAFWHPPTQMLSRLALQEASRPYLIGFPYDGIYSGSVYRKSMIGMTIPFSQSEHYFSRHGIGIGVTDEPDTYSKHVQQNALQAPVLWHFHQASAADSAEVELAVEELDKLGYAWCGSRKIGLDTTINEYAWRLLDCQPPSKPDVYHTAIIEYEFYGAGFNTDTNTIAFIGRWMSTQEIDRQSYNMSYQVLSDDWENVAQLDLPLVAEGELRRFSIDASHVQPGKYRLVLVLYNPATGARLKWEGDLGYIPEMLELATITIAAP